tara:strand:- start:1887 stop:4730 length:2844 start_codon:yes stop_codon:yes gene_type:complete
MKRNKPAKLTTVSNRKATLKTVTAFFIISSLLSWQANADENADKLYENALISYQNKDITTSIIHLKNALQKQQDHLASRILLAQALIATGDGALAEVELNKARAYNADQNRLVTLFAHAYLLQHKYDEVLRVTKPSTRGNKIEAELLVFKGQALIGQKLLRSADSAFEEALSFSPDNQMALLGRAQIALNTLKIDSALTFVEQAIAGPLPFINGWILKANILAQSNQLQGAMTAIEQALEIDNTHLAARLTKAMLHISLQEYALAEAHVDYIISEIPNEPRAGYLKAIINANLNKEGDKSANIKLTEVIATLAAVPDEIMKTTPDYYFLAGLTNFQYGNLVDAKRYLEKYLSYVELHLQSVKMIAQIDLQQGNTISAKNLLSKTNLSQPDDPDILTLLGMTYLQLGDVKKAENYFKQVLVLKPNSEIGITNLARSKMQSGEYQLAIDALLTIKDNKVNNIQIKLLLIDSYEKGKLYDDAIAIAQELVQQYPNDSYFQQRLGALLGWNNKIIAARVAFTKALLLDNTNIAAIIHLARMDIIENDLESAKVFLNEKLKQFPQDPLIMTELSNIFLLENNYDEALLWVNKAHVQAPNNFYVLSKLVNTLVANKQLTEATEFADLYIGQNPSSLDSLKLIARLYQQQNKHQQAIMALRDYVKKSTDKSSANITLAQAQLKAGDNVGAMQSYKKAIVADQKSVSAHIGLVNLVISNKDEAFALSLIENIAKLTASKSLEQVLLGDLYYTLDNIVKAKKHYLTALSFSDQKQAILGLYRSFKKINELEQVIPYLKDWLKKYPDDIAVEISLADSYKSSGQLQQAADNYEKLLSKHGQLPILLNNAANIYFSLNQQKKARQYAAQAYSYLKDNVAIIDTYAWIESRLGNHLEALALFRYALTKDYDNAEIKYHLAVTLDKLGRTTEAKGHLIEAINSQQLFQGKEQAKRLLATW